MSTFDLWIKWIANLQVAREALQANVGSINFGVYRTAYRYALRRCEGLERALTAN